MPTESLSKYCERNRGIVHDEHLAEVGYPYVEHNWFSQYDDLYQWLSEQFGDEFLFGVDGVWFSTDDDAFKFKMYWC